MSVEGGPPFLVAVDGVTDPGNLGRAAALGRVRWCDRRWSCPGTVRSTSHPTVTKAAAGAVEHLRFSVVGGLPVGAVSSCATWAAGWSASTQRGSTSLWDLPAADGPIALVLGAEGAGLSRPGPPAL